MGDFHFTYHLSDSTVWALLGVAHPLLPATLKKNQVEFHFERSVSSDCRIGFLSLSLSLSLSLCVCVCVILLLLRYSVCSDCRIGFWLCVCVLYPITVETQSQVEWGREMCAVISQLAYPLPIETQGPSGGTENLRNLRQGRKRVSSQNRPSLRRLVSAPGNGINDWRWLWI